MPSARVRGSGPWVHGLRVRFRDGWNSYRVSTLALDFQKLNRSFKLWGFKALGFSIQLFCVSVHYGFMVWSFVSLPSPHFLSKSQSSG